MRRAMWKGSRIDASKTHMTSVNKILRCDCYKIRNTDGKWRMRKMG